jgi:hypothetical protein
MGLAGAGRAEEDEVVPGGDEVELAEVEDERLLQRALEGEVELLERLPRREARLPDPGLAAVRLPGGDLGLQQRLAEALVRPLLLTRPLAELRQRPGGGRGP